MSRQSTERPGFRPRSATPILFGLIAGLVAPLPSPAQTPADSVAITQAALDYMEGWKIVNVLWERRDQGPSGAHGPPGPVFFGPGPSTRNSPPPPARP